MCAPEYNLGISNKFLFTMVVRGTAIEFDCYVYILWPTRSQAVNDNKNNK